MKHSYAHTQIRSSSVSHQTFNKLTEYVPKWSEFIELKQDKQFVQKAALGSHAELIFSRIVCFCLIYLQIPIYSPIEYTFIRLLQG